MVITRIKGGQIVDKVDLKDGLYQIEPHRKKRTNPQNAWIHAYLFPPASKIMTEKLGVKVSSKMAKAILKARCATDYVKAVDEWIITPTSEMNTVRMSKFIEDCLRYMAEKYHEFIEGPPEP